MSVSFTMKRRLFARNERLAKINKVILNRERANSDDIGREIHVLMKSQKVIMYLLNETKNQNKTRND